MSKLCSSDLSKDYVCYLESDINDATKMIANIETFIKSYEEKKLVGHDYTIIFNKLYAYCNALQSRVKLANMMIPAFQTGIETLSSYLAPDIELDDSMLPSLRSQLASAQSSLAEAQSNLIKTVNVYDDKGSVIGTEEYEDPIVKAEIERLTALIADLDAKIKKLEQLKPTDNSVCSTLSTTLDEAFNEYTNSISEIDSVN